MLHTRVMHARVTQRTIETRRDSIRDATRLHFQRRQSMATATAGLKRMYIDGKWCEADNGKTLGVINPATEEVLEEIAYGGRAEVRRALDAAQKAIPGW